MRPEGCDLLFVILVDTRKESVSYTIRAVPLQVNSISSRARPAVPISNPILRVCRRALHNEWHLPSGAWLDG
jgi:hypothetical protein